MGGADVSRIQPEVFSGNSVEVDLRVGGAFIVRTPDGALHISGEVFECDPPKKLTVTFNVNWPALIEKLGPTLVTWEIEPQDGGITKLTVVHDQLEGAPKTAENVAGGWMYILSGLKTWLETGEVLTTPGSLMYGSAS